MFRPRIWGKERPKGGLAGPRRFCGGPAALDRFVTPARLNLGLASMMRDGQAKARPNEPDDFMPSVPPDDRCGRRHLPSLRSHFHQRFAHRHRAFANVGDLGLVCSFAALVVNTVQATRSALEVAGVAFTNGAEPGVKLKAKRP